MHLAFIPYGIKNFVDFFMEDLNHKYLPLRLYKEGEKDKSILMQCQIRLMPFGVVELVFPKEFLNEVLSAFRIKNEDEQSYYLKRLNKKILGINPLNLLRKILHLKPIPKYEIIEHPNFPMPNYMNFIAIIPIGIREDGEFTEPDGWRHEAI